MVDFMERKYILLLFTVCFINICETINLCSEGLFMYMSIILLQLSFLS